MGSNTNTRYRITDMNSEYKYYKCKDIASDSADIYLSFGQFTLVNVVQEEVEEKEADTAHEFPYFTDFRSRTEKSVLNQNDFADDPSGYLKAIRAKYNIKHRRELNPNNDEDMDVEDEPFLRPWIEGKMEKLSAESGYFVKEKWKTRLFRLFDEALVWFDDDSFLSKLYRKRRKGSDSAADDNEYMTPFGVLPLAMVTGIKTADIDGQITEDELLRLELEVGDEGIIVLKCSDVNQRIKWYECLHSAIFAVKRPLFVQDKDLWRISEPKPPRSSKQITKSDLKRRQAHVKMGKSLAFLAGLAFTPATPKEENDDLGTAFDNIDTTDSKGAADIELQTTDSKTKSKHMDQVPSMSQTNPTSSNDDVKIL
eukprot:468687_1